MTLNPEYHVCHYLTITVNKFQEDPLLFVGGEAFLVFSDNDL